MEKITSKIIGYVENDFDYQTDNLKIKSKESVIHLFDQYEEALLTIESMDYIDVLFIFHKSEGKALSGRTKSGNKRGVFASRLPERINSIGVTSVKLVNREGNRLTVIGLDALNGSPVIDIKSADTSLFGSESDELLRHNSILKKDPRKEIRNNILKNQTDILMMKAAQMHGHYCPGLAMGIMAATYAMNALRTDSDGMEDLMAVTETNNCFSDGVQFVTGCTFGNNAMIFNDIGKIAFTLTKRDGKGIRIICRNEARSVIREYFPEFQNLYQKVVAEKNHEPGLLAQYKNEAMKRAFGTLQIPFEKLYRIERKDVIIPEYAPSHKSLICDSCGELFMAGRKVKSGANEICLSCSNEIIGKLDGNGIHF